MRRPLFESTSTSGKKFLLGAEFSKVNHSSIITGMPVIATVATTLFET